MDALSQKKRKRPMRKLETSDILSNLLILASVSLACAPFLLGDHLVPMVASLVNETFIVFNQLSSFVLGLLS